MLLFLDDLFLRHAPGPGHPESPARLAALAHAFAADPPPGTARAMGHPASRDELLRVHAADYVDLLESIRGRSVRLDPDTATSPGSVEAAVLAAGTVVEAVTQVVTGRAPRAFVLARPPGHHAEADAAMGFCLLNSIAIGAAHAVAELGCRRVLIADWDVHHGNGTQHAFEDRRDVLFFDTHQSPFYPGSGGVDETGIGAGRGYTINVPLPAGCGDAEYAAAWCGLLPPIADAFAPDLVLVSAGFDAHRADPLAGMALTESGFAALAGVVRDIADRHAGGRVVLALEGGYDPAALVASVRAALTVFGGGPVPQIHEEPAPAARRAIDAVRRVHAARWYA